MTTNQLRILKAHRREKIIIQLVASDWVVRRDCGFRRGERSAFAEWLARDMRHRAAMRELSRVWFLLNAPRLAGRGPALDAAIDAEVMRRERAAAAPRAAEHIPLEQSHRQVSLDSRPDALPSARIRRR
jgi:ferric-dicitrate binding protein FerR (iron transport regulator)